MSTLGSHPGAISFRFSIMVILILIFMIYFLFYFDDAKIEIERASILQTKNIIDSSLAVAFATYAVNGNLNGLNDLAGGNPFVFLKEYKLLPTSYQGVIEGDDLGSLEAGWYYLGNKKTVAYIPHYLEGNQFFSIVLNYKDHNQSGRFESESDRFENLVFIKKPQR